MTQRGNRRMETFFCEDDYRAYLALLTEWCGRCRARIWAYCLMPDHVHLILVPGDEAAFAAAVGQVHVRYTRRINFRNNWRGYLWQGRFSLCVMDEMHLLRAAAYVERNPVRAGLTDRAEQWPWSSALAHVTNRPEGPAEVDWLADRVGGWVCTWGEYLAEEDCEPLGTLLRRGESTGRPVGDASFLATIGRMVGRDLAPKKRARKPKRPEQ